MKKRMHKNEKWKKKVGRRRIPRTASPVIHSPCLMAHGFFCPLSFRFLFLTMELSVYAFIEATTERQLSLLAWRRMCLPCALARLKEIQFWALGYVRRTPQALFCAWRAPALFFPPGPPCLRCRSGRLGNWAFGSMTKMRRYKVTVSVNACVRKLS